jgi:hypothetical protein
VFDEKYAIAWRNTIFIFDDNYFKFGLCIIGNFLCFIVTATTPAQARPSDAYFLYFNFGLYKSES